MAKEKTIRDRLTPAEYWEWRTTIAEMDVEKQKFAHLTSELKCLQKDAEILQARQQLFSLLKVNPAKEGYQKANAEYERFKAQLEKSLGQSLNNKMIDDITFEIKDLPSEKTNNP